MTIQFQNFKVTILGEVKAPGSYKVVSERVSLLDALGMAGDLQINGKRKNCWSCGNKGMKDLCSNRFNIK